MDDDTTSIALPRIAVTFGFGWQLLAKTSKHARPVSLAKDPLSLFTAICHLNRSEHKFLYSWDNGSFLVLH